MRPIHTLGDVRECGFDLVAVCRNPLCRRRQIVDLDRLITELGTMRPALPAPGEVHFTDKMRCQRCGQRGAFLWLDLPYDPRPLLSGMGYKVNNWDGRTDALLSTVALVGHENVANFAFDGAVSAYPGRRITLQQGMRIIRDSRFSVLRGGKA